MTLIVLRALARNDVLTVEIVEDFLDEMSDARSWSANPYVARAKSTLQQQRDDLSRTFQTAPLEYDSLF
ncbi:hypothetical protein [Halalkalicoccus subterraneus]|uniref:hypothetical protein n=1 Tax=Halalkalicoccus subterraneus TaxID=2675002 RepID=UPI001B870486|nr:hypothetical protein [Halalkalicoccus subterraneus]